jgi:hypothetical protein
LDSGNFLTIPAACLHLATEIQDIGLVWQAKWDRGDGPLLGENLIQAMVGSSLMPGPTIGPF